MKKIKKIDLHLHLDGSINKEYAEKLLNKKLANELTINGKCKNLKEYLDKFDLPISLLQTKENLEQFSYLLTKDLANDNVIYAEIRFCPLFLKLFQKTPVSRETITHDTTYQKLKNRNLEKSCLKKEERIFFYEKKYGILHYMSDKRNE